MSGHLSIIEAVGDANLAVIITSADKATRSSGSSRNIGRHIHMVDVQVCAFTAASHKSGNLMLSIYFARHSQVLDSRIAHHVVEQCKPFVCFIAKVYMQRVAIAVERAAVGPDRCSISCSTYDVFCGERQVGIQ